MNLSRDALRAFSEVISLDNEYALVTLILYPGTNQSSGEPDIGGSLIPDHQVPVLVELTPEFDDGKLFIAQIQAAVDRLPKRPGVEIGLSSRVYFPETGEILYVEMADIDQKPFRWGGGTTTCLETDKGLHVYGNITSSLTQAMAWAMNLKAVDMNWVQCSLERGYACLRFTANAHTVLPHK